MKCITQKIGLLIYLHMHSVLLWETQKGKNFFSESYWQRVTQAVSPHRKAKAIP